MSRIIKYPEMDTETGKPIDVPILECDCGHKLYLDSCWANECEKCHTEYNGSGQKLAPRSQWGEETGETF